jgi:hypothetical protein
MRYVYIRTEPQLWTVGFYDPAGKFQPESDHSSPGEAAERTAYMNGNPAPGHVAMARDVLLAVERLAPPQVVANTVVNEWNAAGRMPQMAWDFRGLVCAGVQRAMGDLRDQAVAVLNIIGRR